MKHIAIAILVFMPVMVIIAKSFNPALDDLETRNPRLSGSLSVFLILMAILISGAIGYLL